MMTIYTLESLKTNAYVIRQVDIYESSNREHIKNDVLYRLASHLNLIGADCMSYEDMTASEIKRAIGIVNVF